jgi:hypothetical protein
MKWKTQRRRKASGSSFSLFEVMMTMVGELDVCLVDLVDQEDVTIPGAEDASQRPVFDVAPDVGDVAVAEAGVVEALDGVVDVESLGSLRGRLHVPRLHRHP